MNNTGTCERCQAVVADVERHEDFCARVNDALPWRTCGHIAEITMAGDVRLAPCHGRMWHGGGHIYDVEPPQGFFGAWEPRPPAWRRWLRRERS